MIPAERDRDANSLRWRSGDKITITYKDITAPSSAGRSVFTAQSQSTSAGQLKDLTDGSPTFVVGDVPVGNLVITTAA